MSDKRILMLATMSKLETVTSPTGPHVRATVKGLTQTTKLKAGEQEFDAAQRALQGLLTKIDSIADVGAKLGPKPVPGKPRGISAMRLAQKEGASKEGSTELTLSDGTVLEIPDDDGPRADVDPDPVAGSSAPGTISTIASPGVSLASGEIDVEI